MIYFLFDEIDFCLTGIIFSRKFSRFIQEAVGSEWAVCDMVSKVINIASINYNDFVTSYAGGNG